MMVGKPHELEKQYQLRFAAHNNYRQGVWKILCAEFFTQYIPKESTVLDLGAGWGEFINNIEAEKKLALDLNSEAKDRLSPDVKFLHQNSSQQWPIDTGRLDVVFTSNFLEHLPEKTIVEHTISEAYRCLKPNGIIICLGPNVKCVPGRYWDFWDHYIPLTELSLSEVLRMKGFAIDLCITRFLPYSMSTGKTPPLFLVKLYLKVPLAWSIFGKQFLVIGRKT
jgi:ubiquinone/menaquinone biosynthesis C-methylase UbiE